MGAQSDAIVAELRKQVATAAKALILEIDANLRASPDNGGTPVLTGHARANWIPSIGSPHTGDETSDAAHDAGVAALLRFTLGAGELYVSNAAPYINALNYGHSKQAPALFVENAVERALDTIQQRYASRGIQVAGVAEFRNEMGGVMAGNLAAAYSPFGDE